MTKHKAFTHKITSIYKCGVDDCTLSFKTAIPCEKHRQSAHPEHKPFTCTVSECEFKTAHSTSMRMHVLLHNNPRSFKCTWPGCMQAFSQQTTLTVHERVHTNPPLFTCPHCDRTFSYQNVLNNHLDAMHSGVYQYVCTVCGYGCHRTHHMEAHNTRYHSGQPVALIKRQEQRIAELLTNHSIQFESNVPFTLLAVNNESARRHIVDFILTRPNCILVLEVDEREHGTGTVSSETTVPTDEDSDSDDSDESDGPDTPIPHPQDCPDNPYAISCEIAREQRIITYLRTERNTTLPIGILRYNPHSFRLNNNRQNVPTLQRESALIDTILTWTPNGDETQHLYYSATTVNDTPVANVTLHKDYSALVASRCRPAIVS